MELVELPTEILLQILSNLSAIDVTRCSFCSKFFLNIVKSSVELQYITYLYLARADDNPYSRLSFDERLEILKKREKGWATLKPDFVKEVKVPFEPGSVYDLSGDMYILGDSSHTRLHCLALPSSAEDEPEWRPLDAGDGRRIIDFAINLYEHDLIVLVTAPLIPHRSQSNLELVVRKFSTNIPHPLAKEPVITMVAADPQWYPSVSMEIVGDYLTIIAFFWRPMGSRRLVSVYEWKTGRLVLKIDGPPNSYGGLVFITDTLFLLSNVINGNLEIWKIPTSEEQSPTKPLVCLQLPPPQLGCFYTSITCRAEPNPPSCAHIASFASDETRGTSTSTPSSGIWHSKKPFHPRPDDSIILLHIRIDNGNVLDPSEFYTLFVHREALIRIVEQEDARRAEPPQLEPQLSYGGINYVDIELSFHTETDEEETTFGVPTIPSTPQTPAEAGSSSAPAVSTVTNLTSTSYSSDTPTVPTATQASSVLGSPTTPALPNGAQTMPADTEDDVLSQPFRDPIEKDRHEPEPTFYLWRTWSDRHVFMISTGIDNKGRWITTSCGGRFVLLVPYSRRERSIDFPTIIGAENLDGLEAYSELEALTPQIWAGSDPSKAEGISNDFMNENNDDDFVANSGHRNQDEDSMEKVMPVRVLVFDFNPHNVREAEKNPRVGRVVIKPPAPGLEDVEESESRDTKGKEKKKEPGSERGENEVDVGEGSGTGPTTRSSTPAMGPHQLLQLLGSQGLTMIPGMDVDHDEPDFMMDWQLDWDWESSKYKPFCAAVESRLPCVITVATTHSTSPHSSASSSSAGPLSSFDAHSMESLATLSALSGVNGLMADDERILGVNTNRHGRIGSISIVHFGA